MSLRRRDGFLERSGCYFGFNFANDLGVPLVGIFVEKIRILKFGWSSGNKGKSQGEQRDPDPVHVGWFTDSSSDSKESAAAIGSHRDIAFQKPSLQPPYPVDEKERTHTCELRGRGATQARTRFEEEVLGLPDWLGSRESLLTSQIHHNYHNLVGVFVRVDVKGCENS